MDQEKLAIQSKHLLFFLIISLPAAGLSYIFLIAFGFVLADAYELPNLLFPLFPYISLLIPLIISIKALLWLRATEQATPPLPTMRTVKVVAWIMLSLSILLLVTVAIRSKVHTAVANQASSNQTVVPVSIPSPNPIKISAGQWIQLIASDSSWVVSSATSDNRHVLDDSLATLLSAPSIPSNNNDGDEIIFQGKNLGTATVTVTLLKKCSNGMPTTGVCSSGRQSATLRVKVGL